MFWKTQSGSNWLGKPEQAASQPAYSSAGCTRRTFSQILTGLRGTVHRALMPREEANLAQIIAGLVLIERKAAERNARQVERGGHQAGRGMGVRPQQGMADFVGNHVAEDTSYVFRSTSSHSIHQSLTNTCTRRVFETVIPSVPRSGLARRSISVESRPTWMMDSAWETDIGLLIERRSAYSNPTSSARRCPHRSGCRFG